MKKLSLFLVVVMLLTFAAAVSAERDFTDSTGRTVTVPDKIEKVAVSGPLTQIVLFALCPEKFVGISEAWDETAAQFIPSEYLELPLLGRLYGGKGLVVVRRKGGSGLPVKLSATSPGIRPATIILPLR